MAKTVVALEATINASGAEGSVKSLKAQLKEAQADVQALSDKFGATSEQAVNAAKKAADLRDRIGDAKALTDAFNPDAKFKAFSSALQGVVGGFSALQGAQALFGAESEDLQKVLVKVQSAMALSQGLNSIMEAKDAFMILGTVIKTNVVSAFSTLRGAIMTTGIGALIVAVGLLINYFSDLADEAEKAAEAQKKLNEETKKYADVGLKGELDYLERTQKLELARAKNKGKSEQEIFNLEQDFRRQKGRALQRHYEEIKGVDEVAAQETKTAMKNLQAEIEVAELEHQTKLKEARENASKEARAKNKENREKEAKEKEQADKDAAEKEKARLENIAEQNKITDELILRNRIQSIKDEFDKKQFELAVQKQKEIDDQIDLLNKGLITQEEYNQRKALIDANYKQQEKDLLDAHNKEIEDKNKKSKEQQAADDLAAAKALAQQKKEIQDAEFGALDAGVNFLSAIAGKNKALQKAAVIAEGAVNIAKQITANQTANIAALATPQAIATGGAAAAPVIAFNNIKTALAVATTIAATGKALAALGGGGSISGGGQGGGTTAPVQPQVSTTTLNQGQVNQLSNAAARAFVLESDISGNQERIQRLNRAARIN